MESIEVKSNGLLLEYNSNMTETQKNFNAHKKQNVKQQSSSKPKKKSVSLTKEEVKAIKKRPLLFRKLTMQ